MQTAKNENTKQKMNSTINADRCITEHEVADLIGRSVSSLRRDRCYGQGIPFIKFKEGSGAVRYRMSDVIAWLDSHTVQVSRHDSAI